MLYVTSDLHGYPLDKFQRFLNKAGFSPDDTLYVLGDVIDRIFLSDQNTGSAISLILMVFILVFLIIIGVVALGTIAADVTRDEIERQDVQIKRDVSNMRELQSLGRSLTAQCDDAVTKEELQKLSDALRFSDPVSSEATAASEAELKRLLTELQTALFDGDTSGATGLCKQAQIVLAERNRICKLNK